MRIPSLLNALKTTLHIFIDKMKYDSNCDQNRVERKTMPQFVYFFMVKKYGLEKLADMHVTQLQLAMVHHRKHKVSRQASVDH